jgi:hypothetical protein
MATMARHWLSGNGRAKKEGATSLVQDRFKNLIYMYHDTYMWAEMIRGKADIGPE